MAYRLTCPIGTLMFFAPSATLSTNSEVILSTVKMVARSQLRMRQVSATILSVAWNHNLCVVGSIVWSIVGGLWEVCGGGCGGFVGFLWG
jgi:hypothetical protein